MEYRQQFLIQLNITSPTMVHHPSSTKICQEKCQLRHFWTCVHCLWLFLFVHDHQNQSLHWPGKRKHGSLSLQSQTAASMMKSTQWTWSPTHWQSPPGTQVLKFSSDKLYVCSGRFGVSDYPFMRAMINQAIKLCNETLFVKVIFHQHLYRQQHDRLQCNR